MRKLAITISVIGLLILLVGCGSRGGADTAKVIKSAPIGSGLTVTLSNNDGVLKHGNLEFTLAFKDASDKPVDVGAVSLGFFMPAMGTMAAMNNQATLTTTDTPGIYRGKAKIEGAGEWQVKISYDGQAGQGQTSFPVAAQ